MGQIKIDYNEKYKKILEQSYINPNLDVDYPPTALSKGTYGGHNNYPVSICTYGNFSFIQAPPKSKKSFLVSLMGAAYLSNGGSYFGNFKSDRQGKSLIHYDTEQGEFHAQKVFKRVVDMNKGVDLSECYFSYGLRRYSAKERLEFINWHLYEHKAIGMVIIDGIADLINDVNDIEASSELVQHLMRWTNELNIHIITVIHSNWNSDKPTGHLGSFLEKKAETQIALKPVEDTSNVLVTCKRSRGYAFDDFAFTINNQGLPEILEDLPTFANGETFTRL